MANKHIDSGFHETPRQQQLLPPEPFHAFIIDFCHEPEQARITELLAVFRRVL
jgi:hypothetical protein